ncbi:hypothetical protein B296_00001032 [Ensete ventricosum]|uniref:Uncharacterized protein n=1 Tax=Ensete ventricosum TaxID=4639 RepID=A0A427AZ19_ENSVE|nr:hypothetical protein B296_00001032 [Ensete ventricosum]
MDSLLAFLALVLEKRRSMVCMHEVCQNGRRQSREWVGRRSTFCMKLARKIWELGRNDGRWKRRDVSLEPRDPVKSDEVKGRPHLPVSETI